MPTILPCRVLGSTMPTTAPVPMKNLLLLCVLAASHCAFAGDVFPRGDPRPFNLADELEVDATIGGYPIWHGEKKWRLYELSRSDSGGTAQSVPLGRMRVFQTENKRLVATMFVSANLAQAYSSDWTDEPCKRDDMLFKANLSGRFRDVNCVTINHLTNYGLNPTGAPTESLFALFKEQGVDVPPTMLQISFTRYSSNLRWLVVSLTVNPELMGFPREAEPKWTQSPWHKSKAFGNAEKKRFIDALAAWSLQFAKQMDVAFDKSPQAFTSISSWRAISDSKPGTTGATGERPKVSLD